MAVALATLIHRPFPPNPTIANQLTAIFGWGLVMILAPAPVLLRSTLRAAAPPLIVLALAAAACAIGIFLGTQPSPPGIGILGIMGLAAVVMLHGAAAGAGDVVRYFRPFAMALVVGGVCCGLIAFLQVFAYHALDNDLIAWPVRLGRPGGNVGQSNQFADIMLWGIIGSVPLARSWQDRAGAWLPRVGWCLAVLTMLFGVVLTGSRTALVALALLASWGLADRNLARPLRLGLLSLPFVAALMLWAIGAWSHAHEVTVVLLDRSDATDATSFRGGIWQSALVLIRQQPWLGVGWGQFNFAWTLTPSFARGAGLVSNTHNLPLQLAVELGVPAALLMMGLLVVALFQSFRRVWHQADEAGLAARSALLFVLVMGLHSMLEYPLWYAYLLLPTAWAFGVAVGTATALGATGASPDAARVTARNWRAVGLMMVVLAPSAWMDYLTIVDLFLPRSTSLPFDQRVAHGQASPLFANEADYVAVTERPLTPDMLPVIERSSHVLLNGRLMYAWANILYEQGQVDKARYMAARLREFNLPGPKPWFAPCDDAAVTAKPFQCLPPEHPVSWRDFR
ncbi:PglL family O-oligosaccharyltransferase [Scleromatobacter humisilvae]|uniref:Wzy polymerase domain-containing protein n=1 Tax=Scleromatobacter humisilvae TaxID=2897159 RepID=A0A9X1YQR9_9BURK|nr:O-antigen ligase family protein [Scleromatobacter humisilvae]MCK9689608.1 Wzy polymerase domain-containing protein [Scleromatobacter humisilvae]